METQSVSLVFGKNQRGFTRVRLWLTLGVTLATSGPLAAASTDCAQQVAQSHLFMEPLVWVGAKVPPDTESQELLTDVETFKSNGTKAGFAALERFLTEHPHSPWAPALEVNMAGYYRDQGRYSLALAYWQSAWNATKDSQDAAGQKVAVQAFAGWTWLLASLGRTQELTPLFGELDALHLPLGHDAITIQNTRDALGIMKARPEVSYRCGSFALGHVAMALHLNQQTTRNLFEIESPDGGFTMAQLLALAKTNGLAVEAVRRPEGAALVVPCVVHWKLNHYAAITEQQGDRYLVEDPTFNGHVWMDAATIIAESSGEFILPKDKVPASWEKLTEVACAKIYGKGDGNGWNNNNDDGPKKPCPDSSDCDPPASNDGTGGAGGGPSPPGCGKCNGPGGGPGGKPPGGMPEWYVSEPYITLWLTDSPLLYHQSSGQWMPLDLSYKSRGVSQSTALGGFGDNWYCDWLDMLQQSSSGAISNIVGSGGVHSVNWNGSPDYKTGDSYGDVSVGGNDPPGSWLPNGSKNVYGYTNTVVSGSVTNYLLTERLDQYGRVLNRFNYRTTNFITQLIGVVDLDGRTNTLTYGDTNRPWLITAVTDPYGRAAHFNYNSSGLLTNIVDAQGMSSYFKYDSSEEITNLITPYGTNSFQYFDGNDSNGHIARSLLITEPTGDHQMYAYRDVSPDSIPDSPYGYNNDRLSFHWNRRQYQAVSSTGQTNILAMTQQDYQQASVKQWLHSDPTLGTVTVSDTMCAQADAYDPIAGIRPGNFGYVYQGEVGLDISDGSTDTDALQRVTAIYTYVSGYTAAMNMIITRNTLGRPTSYVYNNTANYNPLAVYTNVFDASGTILQYELGPNQELTRGYGYDSVITNLLVSVTNAAGDVLSYTHAATTLKVTSITFPTGLVRNNIYYTNGPAQGFLEIQADLGIRTNSFGWQNGNLVAQTNELGLVTTYTYDNLNRLTGVGYPDGTTTSNIYSNLDIVATKDRLNQWTYFGYNSVDQLVAMTNADNQVTTYFYCGCGSPDQITRWNGSTQFITLLNYDIIGRLTNIIYPDNYQLNYAYDTLDRLQTVTDGDGNQLGLSWYVYGLANLLQSASLGGGTVLSQQFDPYGRVMSSTDRNNVTITNGYDFLDRLVARQAQGGLYAPSGLESFTYDSRGLEQYVDQLGHTTKFGRDVAGRVLNETNANIEILQFTYNPADELLTLTNGKSQTTTWGYDPYGRVTNKVDALGTNDFVYQYDADNRLTNRWSAAKGNTVYAYDPIGNLTNVYYVAQATSLSYAYDCLNRLTNMLDALGNTTFTWTPGDQLAGENGPWPADAVAYTYDPGSRLRIGLGIAAPNADAWMQSYGYDSAMRLSNVVSAAGSFIYTYDTYGGLAPDEVSWLNFPGQSGGIDKRFDALGRVIETYFQDLDQEDITYAYDAGSEVTQTVFSVSFYNYGYYGSFPGYSRFMAYAYDNIGQLKGAQGFDGYPGYSPTPARLQEQFGYAYDKAWNLNTRTNNALVQSFSVNNVNELSGASRSGTLTVAGTATEPSYSAPYYATPGVTSVTVNTSNAVIYADGTFAATNMPLTNGWNSYTAIAEDNLSPPRWSTNTVSVYLPASPSYTYDANGNLLSDGTRNFAYDCENEMSSVWVTNVWRQDFVYDGLLRKRIELDYAWNSSAWLETNETRFVYDGYLVVQERNASNIPQVTYTRGNDLSGTLQGAGGIGGLLARTDMGKWIAGDWQANDYYFSDAQGNIVAMVDTNGNFVAQYAYDPFGNMEWMSGPLAAANKIRFSTKEWDDQAGLYYYGFRFYDPILQRWLNRDQLGELRGVNLFEFGFNNALFWVDPLGLDCIFSAGIGGTIGGNPFGFPGPYLGGSVSLGFDPNSGQLLLQLQGAKMVGLGGYAGVGFQGGVSSGSAQSTWIDSSTAFHGEVNVGDEESVGISVDANKGGVGVGFPVAGRYGVGAGGMIGAGSSTTVTIATPALFPPQSGIGPLTFDGPAPIVNVNSPPVTVSSPCHCN